MGQAVKGTKSDDQSLIPRTHTVEGQNQLLQAALWYGTSAPCMAPVRKHTHTNKYNNVFLKVKQQQEPRII